MTEKRKQNPKQVMTIFDAGAKERQQAITNLLRGKTPVTEVKQRETRGGKIANFVNTYYMTRQLSLISGFRWSSEYMEDRARPNWDNPIEVGVRMKVTIWDASGKEYSHTCWGRKEVIRYTKDDPKGLGRWKVGDIVSLFDDLKAAESDAVKKCCSYFGIANDVYGGKELEYFETDEGGSESEQGSADMTGDEASRQFGKFLTRKHIAVSKALAILKVDKISDIEDFKQAHDTIVKELNL